MSSGARREIGEYLAEQPLDYICGCFPEDIRTHDGVEWAYTRILGFHSPFEPHPTDGVLPARWFLTGQGEGGAC